MFVCKGIFQEAVLFSTQSLSIGLHNGEIRDGERDALLCCWRERVAVNGHLRDESKHVVQIYGIIDSKPVAEYLCTPI